jgi:hypothetical protein
MDQELEKILVEKYPKLYRDYGGDIRQTCMGWGFTCKDGWYNIIDDLSFKIKEIDTKDRVVADQVKEKFGGLRFYYHINDYHYYQIFPWSLWLKIPYKIRPYLTKARQFFYKRFDEKINDLVYEAERKSYKTCERCGCPGQRRSGGWIRTLCDPCEEIYRNPDADF